MVRPSELAAVAPFPGGWERHDPSRECGGSFRTSARRAPPPCYRCVGSAAPLPLLRAERDFVRLGSKRGFGPRPTCSPDRIHGCLGRSSRQACAAYLRRSEGGCDSALLSRSRTSGLGAAFYEKIIWGCPLWGRSEPRRRLCRRPHFTLTPEHLYSEVPVSAGYGDKRVRVIGTADPGAVPGGSTRTGLSGPLLTGPNQDRRVLKSACFRPEWDHRNGPSHKCQR
jgi:hypothetical protein